MIKLTLKFLKPFEFLECSAHNNDMLLDIVGEKASYSIEWVI